MNYLIKDTREIQNLKNTIMSKLSKSTLEHTDLSLEGNISFSKAPTYTGSLSDLTDNSLTTVSYNNDHYLSSDSSVPSNDYSKTTTDSNPFDLNKVTKDLDNP